MIAEELREILKEADQDLTIITSYMSNAHLQEDINKLEAETNKENSWNNPQQAMLLKKLQRSRALIETYHEITTAQQDLGELITLFAEDEQELAKIKNDVFAQRRTIARFKITLLLGGEQDDSNCFITINAGAGGTESQDWADILLRMYLRFCEREKFNVQVLDYQAGEGAGIKSATLFVKGRNSFGLLKAEHGIHRLVRISPYDANKRRHTSFAGVFVIAEVPEIAVNIDQKDLRIDTYRASGAGGQHVNKTDSAVRITHMPSGIVVQCQNERSQTQNKETAMKMLAAKLAEKQKEEQNAQLAKIEKKSIEWGSQIRSYVLHPYKMVKDHRTDQESPQPELVLDGDIMNFIESYLLKTANE